MTFRKFSAPFLFLVLVMSFFSPRAYAYVSQSVTSSFTQIPGATLSPPALVIYSDECYLVVRGTDNGIYYRSTVGGSWTGSWNYIPGATNDAPVLAILDDGLHLVVRGTDNGIYHRYMNLTTKIWSGWVQIPGATSSSPALATSSRTLHVVVRGTDNGIYYAYWTANGGWSTWQQIPGATNDAPVLAILGDLLHLVVRGTDNGIYCNTMNLTSQVWSGWTGLSGATISSPSLVALSPDRLDLVVRGTDNGIYHRTWISGSGWSSSWEVIPGATNDRPAQAAADGSLCLAVRGTDNGIYYNTMNLSSRAWSGWTQIPGATASYPALAAIPSAPQAHMVVRGTDNGIYYASITVPFAPYKVYGLNFGPYTREGQDPNHRTPISEEQIRELMVIIAPYTKWVRTFGCTDGLEKAGKIAHELGLKIAAGAWLSNDIDANEEQISNLITMCQNGEADMAIVGSEVLRRNDLTEAQLIEYINRVKDAVKDIVPKIPVATADTYSVLLSHQAVIDAGDVVLPNYYSFWEEVSVDHAVYHIHLYHQDVMAAAKGKQVIVSETGWPSGGDPFGAAVPSPENAAFHFLNFVSWAKAENVSYFYFEAFDEPWKALYEGSRGAHWGIWDKDGNLKPGMEKVFNWETLPNNWGTEIIDGSGDPAIEFTYVPPYGSGAYLEGRVSHVKPADCRIAVYIKVAYPLPCGWWTKPYQTSPLTIIEPDGSWVCDYTTGGIDEQATEIVAFLLPRGYDPPLMSGGSVLLPTLYENTLAWVNATRIPP